MVGHIACSTGDHGDTSVCGSTTNLFGTLDADCDAASFGDFADILRWRGLASCRQRWPPSTADLRARRMAVRDALASGDPDRPEWPLLVAVVRPLLARFGERGSLRRVVYVATGPNAASGELRS